MTEQSNEGKPMPKNWLDKLLEKRGTKIREVEAPKEFCRVVFPRNPPGFADGSDHDEK